MFHNLNITLLLCAFNTSSIEVIDYNYLLIITIY